MTRLSNAIATLAAAVIAMAAGYSAPAFAQGPVTGVGEIYEPTIWVDPDGCEHWVMDDGAEGYMTPHVRRDGTPVCRDRRACGTMQADQFFATGSANVSPAGRQSLLQFFRSQNATGYIVVGHTDNVGAASFNQRLSEQRASAVAAIGQSAGAQVVDIRGAGERQPLASNATAQGRAENRRVDIVCVN
ncbi:OmpA family protein [Chachezhania antarctica]|uniref:OmpA family protein n=1 Tax=Chachezhania antarctica TaxID=2340860 RepID=UPI001F0967FB|nr:OmpA family protein [Chachezhania antarctica]